MSVVFAANSEAVTVPGTIRLPFSSKARKLFGSAQVLFTKTVTVDWPLFGVQASRARPMVKPGLLAFSALPVSLLTRIKSPGSIL